MRALTLLPRALLGAALLLAAARGRARAQDVTTPVDGGRAPAAGSVAGSVVDAASGLPLPGARVVLAPLPLGVVPTAAAPFVTADRAVTTDSSGIYQFTGLAAGDYALRVQRMGYRPTALQVSLRASASSLVSVGMTIVPVRLEVVEVRAAADAAKARDAMGSAAHGVRTALERLRQQRFLSADVRAFAAGDAQESLALAETDLFRALQRLPGVEARDNYSADLLTRGARGDGTRIYFDGLPLIDPLHGQGSLSGVATEAIGVAFLHPGVRPASLGEGGAAVVDLRTRAGATDTLRGVAHVTQYSARAALDRRAASGRWAFMVAGQRTYLEQSVLDVRYAGIAPPLRGLVASPFRYSDVAGRADLRLGANTALEASAILTRDRQAGHYDAIYFPRLDSAQAASDPRFDNRVASGNGAARLTLVTSLGRLAGRIGIGMSRYDASIDVAPGSTPVDPVRTTTELPMQTSVTHSLLFASLEPARSAAGDGTPPPWSIGAELVRRDARFRGAVGQIFGRELTSADTTRTGELATAALWGERRWRPTAALRVETGLRLEAGDATAEGGGSLRAAPRVTGRYQLSPATSLSAGVGRAYQYTQALPSPALGLTGVIYPTRLWMVAGGDVPALRTDVVTLGAERWLGARWLASANAFARRGGGLVLSDPRPGDLVDRPLFVVGGERARGVELAARRLEGRWTASLAYSYTQADVLAEGLRFTSPYDRRHGVDATWQFRLRPSLRLGAAFAHSSGAPFTRTSFGSVRRPSDTGAGYEYSVPPRADAPYAQRLGSGSTADLLVDWSHAFRSWQLGAFLQLHGSIRPSESVLYAGTVSYSRGGFEPNTSCTSGGPGCASQDLGDTPYPLIPIFGLRVSF